VGCATASDNTKQPIESPIASPSPSPDQSTSPTPTPYPLPTLSPLPSASPSLYVAITYGSDYGYIEAQTVIGAVCNARAILPNGADASGLHNPQTAGADGKVSWLYPQPPTDQGQGVAIVTCKLDGLSGTTSTNFEVGS
jgi:hypothetical protein